MAILAADPVWARFTGYGDGRTVLFWTGALNEAGTPELLALAPSAGDRVMLRLGKLFRTILHGFGCPSGPYTTLR